LAKLLFVFRFATLFKFNLNKMENIFTSLLLFALCTLQIQAQNSKTIQGKVTSTNNEILEGATIVLSNSNKYGITDAQGEFIISGVAPKKYKLTVSYVGYISKTIQLSVSDNEVTNLPLIALQEDTNALTEVVVSGSLFNKTPNAVKAGIQPLDLPQSAVVISNKTLEDQQVNSISDILKNTNGVYIYGTTGGYQEEIAARGFSLGSNNTFKNGVRYYNGMMTETSGIESIEVLKGSAAILFGNVEAGGVINIITKKPTFNFGGKIGMTAGSFDLLKPSFDVYGPLGDSKKIAFRFNGSFSAADSFRNFVSSETTYFNPSFLFKFNDKTNLLVEADYTNDQRTPDFGAGIIDYTLIDLPREQFVGVLWGTNDAEQVSATATLNHQLTKKWNVSLINSFRHYNTELFTNTRPNTSGGTIAEDGTWARSAQRNLSQNNYALQQLDFKGTFNSGTLTHQLLIGADNELYKTKTTRYNSEAYDEINVLNPDYANFRNDIPELSLNTLTSSPVQRFGVYIQDLIGITDYLKLLAGVRYTYQDTESDVFSYSSNSSSITNSYDDALSPRVGLIIQPTENNSIFASYSNSFDTNTGVNIDGNALEPSIIDQYEIGIKNELFNDKLLANVTVYQITNSNLAQTSLANGNSDSNIKELAGEVQSKGIEIDFSYRPLPNLNLMAGYSYNETKYTKTNTYIVGDLLRYNPNHTANTSATYEIINSTLTGLKFGFIATYIGDRFAGRNFRVTVANDTRALIPLEDYFTLDATLAYTYKKITLSTKLANITNVLNYNVHDDNSLNPIAPRNFMSSLTYNF
jgi:iron complex outermembrane receptor protein